MEKIIRKVFVLLTVLTVGFSATSCDEDTITLILGIIQNLAGGQQTSFTGEMSTLRLVRENIDDNNDWDYPTGKSNSYRFKSTQTVTLQVTGTAGSQTATINIPTIQFDDITITGVTMQGIPYVTDGAEATLGKEGFYYTITRTENGKTETITSDKSNEEHYFISFTGGKVTNDGKLTFSISLVMGKEAINADYTGTTPVQQ